MAPAASNFFFFSAWAAARAVEICEKKGKRRLRYWDHLYWRGGGGKLTWIDVYLQLVDKAFRVTFLKIQMKEDGCELASIMK